MRTERQSLRWAIEKWVNPKLHSAVRAQRLQQDIGRRCPCVRVDLDSSAGPLSIIFFRHGDGAWHVYPPAHRRLSLSVPEHSMFCLTNATAVVREDITTA
jgi:hypothetical protein